jgi:hypothetical protein
MRSATIKGWWYGSEITPVPSRMCRVRDCGYIGYRAKRSIRDCGATIKQHLGS